MSKFAEYEPNRRRVGDVSFTVRLASPSDAQSIGAISVARDGGLLEDHIEGATREIEQQNDRPPRSRRIGG